MTTPAQDAAFVAAFQTYAPQFAAYQTALTTYLTALNAPATLTDSSGAVWSWGAVNSDGSDYTVMKNGAGWPAPPNGPGVASLMVLSNGAICVQQSSAAPNPGVWFGVNSAGTGWQALSAAPSPISQSLSAP
jgi:hypothetical protein